MTVAPPLAALRRQASGAPATPLVTFGAVALAVVVVDAATKRLAPLLASRSLALGEWARFTLIHNDRLTGGVSLGAFTAVGHAAVLLALVAMMAVVCRPLSEVDHAAPLWLGLLAGAALGNGVEVVTAAGGATDFLALRYAEGAEVVGNLADLAACAGMVLLVRSVYRIALAIREAPRAVTTADATLADPVVDRVRAPLAATGSRREVVVPLRVYDDTAPVAPERRRPPAHRRRPVSSPTTRRSTSSVRDLRLEPKGDNTSAGVAD